MRNKRMNIVQTVFLVVLLIGLPFTVHAGAKTPQLKVTLSPKKVGPGDILLVTLSGATGTVEGTFNGKTIYFNPSEKSYKAIVGLDLLSEPGKYDLKINSNGSSLRRQVKVTKKAYRTQRLKMPKDMVELSPENEARAEREGQKMAAIWPNQTERLWSGNFINPREGKIGTEFGVKRLMNDIPKNPHTGVDVVAEEGEEVHAPNNAIVALVDEQFFSGNSVILDHGQGIYTMFFHLSKVLVQPGQQVKKGDVIGLVGATGRASGAHLHWGVRVQGARVDPLELIRLKLE
jgi:murein DD-endopeptidase MepM/ murein hydrolase activator NlpD